MSFIEEARCFLQQNVLPDIEKVLKKEDYIHRPLFREEADIDKALAFRQLYQHQQDNNDILEDQNLEKEPNLALIGNAGAGKSFTLEYGYTQAIQRFLDDPAAPFPLSLKLGQELPSSLDIASALNSRYEQLFQRSLTEHASGGALFLDGLDEVLQGTPKFIVDLQIFLQKHASYLKQTVVACRRAAWRSDWFSKGSSPLAVYHVDYLDKEVYAQILPARTTRQSFFDQCAAIGILDLLDSPFDGFYLAREFGAKRPLPKTRRECLGQRIDDALRGTKLDQDKGKAPPLTRLRLLARQLACLASFTHKNSWTPQEATDLLGSSTVLCSDRPASYEEIDILLQRPLFRKSGQQFAFAHQLYQEFLAAEALTSLSLRKQRQLLGAEKVNRRRIQTQHRGIAAFLSSYSRPFFESLVETDPLVTLFAEMTTFSQEQSEKLIRAVLDDAIEKDRLPWWQIPPRGEYPLPFLSKHQPKDKAAFLLPYLESKYIIDLQWGTACAAEWGGARELNSTLSQFAQDTSQNVAIRGWAIDAIAATEDLRTVRSLYNLFNDKEDQVRGHLLRAYRHLESPSPSDFIAKIRGGSHNPNLFCLLQSESEEFWQTLGRSQLAKAFQVVMTEFDRLGDLRRSVIQGLFRRADELRFSHIPPEFIVTCWLERKAGNLSNDQVFTEGGILDRILQQSQQLLQSVWQYVLSNVGEGKGYYWFDLVRSLASCCTEHIFSFLPSNSKELNPTQARLITHVLAQYFYKEPTAERLAAFQSSAPAFTHNLALPRPKKDLPTDLLEEKKQIIDALKSGGNNSISQTWYVLSVIPKILYGAKQQKEVEESDVLQVLDRISLVVQRRVLVAFRKCVEQIHYERNNGASGRSFTLTRSLYEIPFWVLHRIGEDFGPSKKAEIVECYGFLHDFQQERYEELLKEIKNQDQHIWQQSVVKLLKETNPCSHRVIEYLTKIEEPLYLSDCRKRLKNGSFDQHTLKPLLDYLLTLRPVRFKDTLRRSYLTLKSRLHVPAASQAPSDQNGLSYWDQFRPLLALMGTDDDWSWDEFTGRLSQENVPCHEWTLIESRLQLSSNSTRLPIIADWYALARRRESEDGLPMLSQHLLGTMTAIDGEATIRELRRLRREDAFPDARWLSFDILRIEDQLLSGDFSSWESGPLLDFINKESLGVIHNEQDLFEWVRQALEKIQDSLEQRAEGVAGFWDGDTPKEEPDCQNVLWPRIKSELDKFGIVDVEEKFIGPNRCDFWVEYPRPGESSFRVAVELKTARKSYGPTRLLNPVDTQLWKKYLRPTRCQHGIYIVLWFRNAKRYDWPKHWSDKKALEKDIQTKCKEVADAHQVILAPYVIDLTTPPRKH